MLPYPMTSALHSHQVEATHTCIVHAAVENPGSWQRRFLLRCTSTTFFKFVPHSQVIRICHRIECESKYNYG